MFLYVVSSKGNNLDNGKPEKGKSPILVGVSCVNCLGEDKLYCIVK